MSGTFQRRSCRRDFAGRVIEGPAEWIGVEVWGSGGDLGIRRDGTHAAQIVLPIAGVSRKPANLSIEEAAAVGVPFVAAWSALVDAGRLSTGEYVIVSGAAGAVGSAAIEIASARGAQVIALVRDPSEARRIDGTKVNAVADSERADLVEVVRVATGGKGADLALNGVGGAIYRPILDALADGGRMVVYSASGGREVSLDLLEFYRQRWQFAGVNTGALDVADCARILTDLAPLFETGRVRQRQPLERHALSEAPAAYARVASGAPAKIVLVPNAARS